MRSLALLIALAGLAPLLAGCPSCPYDSACDGNTRLTCTLGVDQLVGSPDESAIPCEDPNPVCLTLDERAALCGIAEDRTCEVGAAPRCEGPLLVECYRGFERATDCPADGNVCGEVDGEARCYAEPLTACDPSDGQSCEGDLRRTCLNAYYQRIDCSRREGETCVSRETEFGTSAYCGRPPQE